MRSWPHTLPWQKIQVGKSAETDTKTEDEAIDDDKFKNEKNHYDDPKADSNDLYDANGTNRTNNKYDPDSIIINIIRSERDGVTCNTCNCGTRGLVTFVTGCDA